MDLWMDHFYEGINHADSLTMTLSNRKWTLISASLPFVVTLIVLIALFVPCGAEESGGDAIRLQEYVLKQSAAGSLRVVIEVHDQAQAAGDDMAMDKFLLKFYRVSASGKRKLVAQETSKAGYDNWTQVDDFLGNGRRQVLAVTWDNCSYGTVFDFDGVRVKTVYNTENYDGADFDGRTYLSCLHLPDGPAAIQEEFHVPDSHHPTQQEKVEGFTYVRGESCLMRVMRWREGLWRPVNSAALASILPP